MKLNDSQTGIIIDKQVCDVTKFLNDHPGGGEIIMDFAGRGLFFFSLFWQQKIYDFLRDTNVKIFTRKRRDGGF